MANSKVKTVISSDKNAADEVDKCDLCTASICCTYISQEIDTPRGMRDFDVLLWQLHHRDVHIYRDEDGWYLRVMNVCLNLMDDGRCGIYETRPIICREHENDYCEYDESTADTSELYFASAEELDKYCRKRFKTWDKRF